MINDKGEEVGIIYGWYCIKTGKWYIGQTVNPEKRFNSHIDIAINKKDNNRFHNALRKYGLENWVYCVLEDNVLKANLNLKEIGWIEYYDSFYCGYNLTLGGGGTVSRICTKETRRKLSESHKGQIPWNTGKHLSVEFKQKLSESLKGRSTWNKGKKMPKETGKKISESLKGRSTWNKGKKMPNRRKVSQYNLNGNFIKKYDGVAEAIKENPKAVHIYDVCRGIRKQAGGFIWKFAS